MSEIWINRACPIGCTGDKEIHDGLTARAEKAEAEAERLKQENKQDKAFFKSHCESYVSEIKQLKQEIERLKEYEYMYNDLCK